MSDEGDVAGDRLFFWQRFCAVYRRLFHTSVGTRKLVCGSGRWMRCSNFLLYECMDEENFIFSTRLAFLQKQLHLSRATDTEHTLSRAPIKNCRLVENGVQCE